MSASKNKNYAASVRQRLLNYARSSGQDFIFVLRTFAMERLRNRLSRSPYVDNFVLKGAMLFKLWTGDFYRPTRDIDVLAFKSETIVSLKGIFQEISRLSFLEDGLNYLPDTVKVHEIREEQQYGGLRVTLTAMLGSAEIVTSGLRIWRRYHTRSNRHRFSYACKINQSKSNLPIE